MLKDFIKENIKERVTKKTPKPIKGDRAPFQYKNELEITVSRNNVPIEIYKHK
jgi:hypothetical protein